MIYKELENAALIGNKVLFEKQTLEKNARRGIDAMLLERSLHCLEYVAQLHSKGLNFIFKGGTACQLLVGKDIQRLSIDIDISTGAHEEDVREILENIHKSVGNQTYRPTDVPKKGLDKVPLLMFNISAPTYYPQQKTDTMIKLDAVLKMPAYETTQTSLSTFYYESELKVRTPSKSSMLGDKLSTLGPNTIGLRADLPVDNVKQFYDVGSLLALDFDMKALKQAYYTCFKEVSSWRGLTASLDEVHQDLVELCKVASAVQHLPPMATSERKEFIRTMGRGVDGFAGYIASENLLTKRRLRDISSRIALLSTLMQEKNEDEILLDFIRNPSRYREAVVQNFDIILTGIQKVPAADRWHIYVNEFKNNPFAMASWFGHWNPRKFAELLI
jgi:hypothetical protein